MQRNNTVLSLPKAEVIKKLSLTMRPDFAWARGSPVSTVGQKEVV